MQKGCCTQADKLHTGRHTQLQPENAATWSTRRASLRGVTCKARLSKAGLSPDAMRMSRASLCAADPAHLQHIVDLSCQRVKVLCGNKLPLRIQHTATSLLHNQSNLSNNKYVVERDMLPWHYGSA